MPSETVSAELIGERSFLLRDRNGFPLVMTQPMGVNGADLLPLSLIGCSAWDVADYLRTRQQKITRLEVSAESEQDAEPPWRFRRIRIHYRFVGESLDPDLIREAIELSETKYCSIYATLEDCVELTTDHEILEG